MKKLKDYIKLQYNTAKDGSKEYIKIFMFQAQGAADFYIYMNPEKADEIQALWGEWYDKFMELYLS